MVNLHQCQDWYRIFWRFDDTRTSTFAYDSEHHMISATNVEGLTYVNDTFDEIGRVLTQKEAGKAGVMSLSYEDTQSGGVLVTINDGNGGTIEVESNAKGQRIRVKDVNGAETKYAYDRYANLVSETDALGNTVMYEYDEEGNLIKTYDTVVDCGGKVRPFELPYAYKNIFKPQASDK